MEIDSDFRAYQTLKHQHVPEIEQTLGVKLVFTPHLLPMKRGILSTAVARLKGGREPGAGERRVRRRVRRRAAGEAAPRRRRGAHRRRGEDAAGA